MKTLNDAVQERFGRMVINLCEAEVFLADREAKIAELEQENERLAGLLAQYPPETVRAVEETFDTTFDSGNVDDMVAAL